MVDFDDFRDKVHEDESFWKNALSVRIAHTILYKICIHSYVLQIEPKEPWAVTAKVV